MFFKTTKQKQLQAAKISHLQTFDIECVLLHLNRCYNVNEIVNVMNSIAVNQHDLIVSGNVIRRVNGVYKIV